MAFCRAVEFLYEMLPLRLLRDWFIRTHMERCPHCQARLLSREEAKGLLVAPDGLGDTEALWRQISSESGRLAVQVETAPAGGVKWRWAPVAASVAILIVAGFWLLREVESPDLNLRAAGPADRFEIEYIHVGGAPARTFVYQPQGTDTVLVWAQRTP
jgi:hypothetical protein